MKVFKFGGSSLENIERLEKVIILVSEEFNKGEVQAVIFSAFGDVTDTLLKIALSAKEQDINYKSELKALENRHLEIFEHFFSPQRQSTATVKVKLWFNDLSDILSGIYQINELSKRCLDYILSFGECYSAYIISQIFQERRVDAEFLDAREVIVADENFGKGLVDFKESFKLIKEKFKNTKALQCIPGFIARTLKNETVTLGRGGSDFSAAIFAAALQVDELVIWTDVDGFMTAAPRKVPRAFQQEYLTYEEIMELSHFGAQVIYPPTIQPVLNAKIPLRIRNTFNHKNIGTLIDFEDRERPYTISGISSIPEVALCRLQGSGMVGVSGISSRMFASLAKENINVILITQASSEHSICIAIDPMQLEIAEKKLNKEFALEIKAKVLQPIISEKGFSIISVVGRDMHNYPGVAGQIFKALGTNGINLSAIAQGSSELSISVVVKNTDEIKALKTIHAEFFYPQNGIINVFLIGVGLIGKELLLQLSKHSKALKEKHAHDIKIIGLANTKYQLFSEDGIDPETALEDLIKNEEKYNIINFVDKMIDINLYHSVFVDCTASDEIGKQYYRILDSSIAVITPNKKAMSGNIKEYKKIKTAHKRRRVNFLYETNVGAGLPIISTLNDLLKSGDSVIKIEAVLSGTLSYIFNSFVKGTSFSDIVIQAKESGYTEPDPRDDLNGMDVARKILILAREIGLELELSDIEVESLIPDSCKNAKSVEEFLSLLKEADGFFNDKLESALAKNARLSYIASLIDGKATVKLEVIDSKHPFYNLSGSDNIISLTTRRYKECPLVVRGPGAGAEVTAAGVFADIIRIG